MLKPSKNEPISMDNGPKSKYIIASASEGPCPPDSSSILFHEIMIVKLMAMRITAIIISNEAIDLFNSFPSLRANILCNN